LGISYLPQLIIFGDQTYRDDTEIDTTTFLEKLRNSSSLPKTAAPPPALYTPIFSQYAGDTLIVITPSSDISGTYRSAEVAAQDFPEADIRIIDSRTVAGGLASIVLQAVRWVDRGIDPDTLVSCIQDLIKRERVYFMVDTLEFLHKGGRIGGAQALMGSILQVKPILTLKNGRTEPVESQRTKKRAMARFRELIISQAPSGAESYLSISHCNAEQEANDLAQDLSQALNISHIPIYLTPPAIVVHGGPGIISASFFTCPN
jgi:DegV family protein with EDD domain